MLNNLNVSFHYQFVSVLLPCIVLFCFTEVQIKNVACLSTPSSLFLLSSNATSISSSKLYQPNRPFFNIAHMVNSVEEIGHYLDLGANAIETDVYFAPNATPVFTFHGYPCDCFRHCGQRERINVFFSHIRNLTTPASPQYDKRLLLIVLDLKLVRISHSAKALAGQELANIMLNHLYNSTTKNRSDQGSRIRAVISIGHVFDYDFVLGFQNEMEQRNRDWLASEFIGWDVGMNDPIFAIESMWKRLDMVYNIWQGDGRSNCVSPFYNLGRLSQIVRRRDNPSYFAIKNYIRKVYQWTVDLTVNIRTALRSNVDAIITNHPERVWSVIREREFAQNYRMATYSDSPWELIWTRPKKPQTSSTLSKPNLSLKLMNGAGDMLDSLARFVANTIKNNIPLLKYIQEQQQHQKRKRKLQQQQQINDHYYRTIDQNDGQEYQIAMLTSANTSTNKNEFNITKQMETRPLPLSTVTTPVPSIKTGATIGQQSLTRKLISLIIDLGIVVGRLAIDQLEEHEHH